MSTFNGVFCAKLYEKGQEITADSLKGDPGNVLSTDVTEGDPGVNGVLKLIEVITLVTDTTVMIPNPVDSDTSVYRIKKPALTNNDLLVVDHKSVEFTKMYKDHAQTLTFYKRDNEWVL
jgi:hypothetical protein